MDDERSGKMRYRRWLKLLTLGECMALRELLEDEPMAEKRYWPIWFLLLLSPLRMFHIVINAFVIAVVIGVLRANMDGFVDGVLGALLALTMLRWSSLLVRRYRFRG